MGERLAAEAPVEADLVLPIPDSGTPAAVGFSRASGIPFSEGLIKNRYVGRTFIQPDQELRQQGVRLKFNPLDEVAGKRVVVVDDSIVRGNTTRQIVAMLFDAGAAEVHVRISSPPVVGPCFYGIDLADEDELIAASRSVEEVREYIGATSLAYLSLDGLHGGDDAGLRRALPRVPHARVPDARSRETAAREAPLRAAPTLATARAAARLRDAAAERVAGRQAAVTALDQLLPALALAGELEEQPRDRRDRDDGVTNSPSPGTGDPLVGAGEMPQRPDVCRYVLVAAGRSPRGGRCRGPCS